MSQLQPESYRRGVYQRIEVVKTYNQPAAYYRNFDASAREAAVSAIE
jgi:hypothetical protein